MKKTVLSITLLLIAITGYPQVDDFIKVVRSYDKVNRDLYFAGRNQVKYKDIDGSPYLNDNFMTGLLFLKSGKVYSGEFRLDIYANQIEFLREEEIYVIGVPDSLIRLDFGESTIVYSGYEEKLAHKKGYFIELENGYYTALLQKNILFRNAEPIKPYHDTPLRARFEKGNDALFLRKGDESARKVSGKNEVISFFGDRGPDAKSFIDKEKLNVRKAEDLGKLVKYINGLE